MGGEAPNIEAIIAGLQSSLPLHNYKVCFSIMNFGKQTYKFALCISVCTRDCVCLVKVPPVNMDLKRETLGTKHMSGEPNEA